MNESINQEFKYYYPHLFGEQKGARFDSNSNLVQSKPIDSFQMNKIVEIPGGKTKVTCLIREVRIQPSERSKRLKRKALSDPPLSPENPYLEIKENVKINKFW